MELDDASSMRAQSTPEDLTLTAAIELQQAKGILKNFKICPVGPALDELTIWVLCYLRHSGIPVKASDSSATLIAYLEQRIASLEGGATAEAATTPRQPLQPAARPQPVASSSSASVSDARAVAPRRGAQKQQKKDPLACPSCGIAHLPTTWTRHDEYIKCLGAAKRQRICPCCSQSISATSLEAHEVTCFQDFLDKRGSSKPLTAIINVKYPLPLDDRREFFCPSRDCIEAFLDMDLDDAAGSSSKAKGKKKAKTKAEMVHYLREAHLDEHFAIHLSELLKKETPPCPIYGCSKRFEDQAKAVAHLIRDHKLRCVVDANGKIIDDQIALAALAGMSKVSQLTASAKSAVLYATPTAAQRNAIRAKRKATN